MDGFRGGLEGVVVAETRLSEVDGARGRLRLRGRAARAEAFAAARCVGWLAHAEEQLAEGRIIRPEQRYVGPRPAGAPAALA